MTTLSSFLNSILLSSPTLVNHSTLECLLIYPLHTAEFTFETTDNELRAFYEFDVYRVVHHVFSSYVAQKDARWSKLVQCAVELSKSDVVFRYLLDQLIAHTEEDWVSVVTNQLEKFVFNQERLSATFAFWSDTLRKSVNNKPVEASLRSLINLPSRFAGRRSKSKFLNRTAFVINLLSVFKSGSFDEDEHSQLCGLLLSELALNGFASELAEFVLDDTKVQLSASSMVTQNVWSKALYHLKTNSMESCLQPILSKSSHPFVVAVLFSRLLDGPNPSSLKILFKLFRRLLFVRYFPNDRLLRNLFGGLSQIVIQYLSSSNVSQLVDMVNKELGLPLLHLWADSTAIQAASVEQRVYTSQALASWFTDFHSPVASKLSIKISDSLMLPDILSGISSHLASPRIEIRTIGMAVGEWLVSLIKLPCDDGQCGSLQFEYEDLEVIKRIKPLFVPFPAFPTDTTDTTSVVSESDFTEKCQAIEARSDKPTSDVDSDDEPDSLDPNHSPFVHLPRRSGQPKMVSSVLSSYRKPRYLRECLDGMLCSKPEDNHISVACYTSAEELIYAHPNAARELVNDFAHVFVHMDLPSCPEESKLASCRHAALVALGTVAPKECARYLTNEFCQSTCSVGQRQNIISAITDIACQLSSDGNVDKKAGVSPSHADDSTPKSLMSSKLVSQTRRFCSHRPPKPQTINQFAAVAGEFFFPLLRSIPQLFAGSHTGTFAHQDASLLANLVASLAVVYMCARLSSVQARMASELLELAPTLLYMETESSDAWTTSAASNSEPPGGSPYSSSGRIFSCGPPDAELNGNILFSDQLLNNAPLELPTSDRPIHAEVCISQFNVETFSVIESNVVEFLRSLGPRHVPTVFNNCENHFTAVNSDSSSQQVAEFLQRCVASISLLLDEADGENGYDISKSVDLRTVPLLVHVYQLVSGDEALPVHELVEVGSETINGGTVWLLPSMEMQGLWESLIFDSDIKLDLLSYAQTALLFADRQVSTSIISWNRVILLYGPPGTGKTSLCRALANKLAIRMANRYSSTKLIELNTMNLMSKWFSESARLVARMFDAIREYLEAPEHLVCLLVDEVESLTAVRSSAMSGCEPSDAIRVVNAVLTQIDQIKRYPNVLVLATSNVTGVIDPAFLDRADIRVFIGPPSAPAIYTIFRSCLQELMRVGLVEAGEDKLLSYQALAAMQFMENKMNYLSLDLWKLSERSVGLNGRTLRKLPLLAHAFHLTKVSPSLRSSLSTSGRLYLGSCQSSAALQSGPAYSVHPLLAQYGQRPTVSVPTFVQALRLTVESQFAEVEALDLASLDKGRLKTHKKRADSALGAPPQGDTPLH
ncbi:ATPase, AAA family [Opisthorchis viverrini]|uniref:Uncharacterized protein n=2 Tax=Opisthorchis viverrini TaxID=6198 RepID=A0A074Z124_OPIVI|nr:hypothetical protein T265_11981 [Opisthorchis viverrini]KER19147.1 hypothetical protein T265_11981 [Opisthorchis viverrini]OON14893.1 ATPase, AAA family [Opisthorchis viverrini]